MRKVPGERIPLKRNIPPQYLRKDVNLRKDVKYLSYQNVISRARKRLKSLIEE